jgi:hypothetical protein
MSWVVKLEVVSLFNSKISKNINDPPSIQVVYFILVIVFLDTWNAKTQARPELCIYQKKNSCL